MFNSLLRLDEPNDIGKSIEDFSLLKILSKKGKNFVAKVKSKLNNKIYTMKRIELISRNDFNYKYLQREKFFIKNLNYEHIVKYYTDFEEDNFLYLITEYVENGDLMQMINSIKKGNYKISEEKLMKIMLQCLKALSYLNFCGIIFCGLKPGRILLDNDFNIKITNFKYAAIYDIEKAKNNFNINQVDINYLLNDYSLIIIGEFKAPEIKQGAKYDKKIDVYSLGIIFCLLAYSSVKIPGDKKDRSDELYNFIKKLVDENPNIRPKAREAYNELKNIFLKKYFHSSSIISYLRCLSSLPNIKDNLLNLIINLLNEGEKPFLKKLYNFITIIMKIKQLNLKSEEDLRKIKEEFNIEIYDFLELLKERGIVNLNIKKEMTPKEFSFILFQLIESELKLNVLNVDINIDRIINNPNYITKNDKLYRISQYFDFKSPISDSFEIISKKEEKCLNCNKIIKESYRKNQFLFIRVELFQNNLDINKIIENLFHNETKEEECILCKKNTNIEKRKPFFNLSKDLIILLDRGEECKYKNFINFSDTLTIDKNIIELRRGNTENYLYTLYGVLIRKEKNDESGFNQRIEDYIYYIRDLNENYFTRNDSSNTYNLIDIKSEGDVVGLFYYCKDLDNNGSESAQNNQNNNNDNKDIHNINADNIAQLMKEVDTKEILNQAMNNNINNNINNNMINNLNNNMINNMNNNINMNNFNEFNHQNNFNNNIPMNNMQNRDNINQQQHMSEVNNINIINNLMMNQNNNNNNNVNMNNNLNNFNNNINNNQGFNNNNQGFNNNNQGFNNNNQGFNFNNQGFNNNNQGFSNNNQINNNQNFLNNINMNNNQNNRPQNNFNNNINFNNNRQLNQNNMYIYN